MEGDTIVTKDGTCVPIGIVFTNPSVIEAILCDYSALKQNSYGIFENDTWYLM